jgi:hypothetical protein
VGGRRRDGDVVHVGREHGGKAGTGLVETLGDELEEGRVSPSRRQLPPGQLRHGRRYLGRKRAGRPGVQVDTGPDRRQRLPERAQPIIVGGERWDHGRMIPAMRVTPRCPRGDTVADGGASGR